MTSILDAAVNLGEDSRRPLASYEMTLEELELAIENNKKAIRNKQPKNPVIGVPPGTVLDGSTLDDSHGLAEEEETEDEVTRLDDSSMMDDADVAGELDDSDSSMDGSTDFV